MKTGIELIAEERKRQIESEGYSIKHDLEHNVREFIRAAITYAMSSDLSLLYRKEVKCGWPWDEESFKPTTPLRDLVKAGALIAAAIDRLNARKEE